jgi:putative ABC transport system permease protein
MLRTLRQIGAVTRISLLSVRQRLSMSLAASGAIALVVFVLLGALALDNGFQHALTSSGADDVAIVLRAGAENEVNSTLEREQQDLLAAGPGIVQENGVPLVSPELYMVVDGIKKSSATRANISLRGIAPNALQVRRGVHLVEGRFFAPGSNEIVVGRGIDSQFSGFTVGSEVRVRGVNWKVVGVFAAEGSVFESELWADLHVIQALMNRGNSSQSLRIRMTSPAMIGALQQFSKADPRLNVDIMSEQKYYAEQAKMSTDLINRIGKPLALIMALGALAGALNTMYASVAERGRDIATLRILGYGHLPTFIGTLLESVSLALAGALLGTLAAYSVFNNMSGATMGASFSTVVFSMSLSAKQLMTGAIWAVAIGTLGGVFPALRATRQSITQVLAE